MEQTLYNRCIEIIRTNSIPLKPHMSQLEPENNLKTKIKALMFDVYGTLFISGSGDIGVSKAGSSADYFQSSLETSGATILKENTGIEAAHYFYATIQAHHDEDSEGWIFFCSSWR